MNSLKERLEQRREDAPRLGPLGEQILAHWKEFCPKTVEQLQQAGTLTRVIFDLQQSARQQLADLHDSGLNEIEAQELVYPQIFQREEE